MGLILGIAIWVVFDKNKIMKTMAKKIVWKHSTCVNVLADTKHLLPMKWMVVTSNPRDFTIIGTLQTNQIHITRHLLWDKLEINLSSVLLKLGTTEVTLPILVVLPSMDKYRVEISWKTKKYHLHYITYCCHMTSPHKLNTIVIQDINYSV